MNIKHKFTIHYLRSYFHCEKKFYKAPSRIQAEKKCFDEFGELDDMNIVRTIEKEDGYMIEWRYWKERTADQITLLAFTHEEALQIFNTSHSDPSEEHIIQEVIDEGPDGASYIKEVEAHGQLAFDFTDNPEGFALAT